MFAGRLAAVDAELIAMGLMYDLRRDDVHPAYRKKSPRDLTDASARSDAILETIVEAVATTTERRQQSAS